MPTDSSLLLTTRAASVGRRAGTRTGDVEPPNAASLQPVPTRRTQQERSSATQRRLCEATVDLLLQFGYERLTTAQIASRAGVSKGARAHHYRSKDDMLVAAYRHLLAEWEQRREAYAHKRGRGATIESLVRDMWRLVFGRPDYVASLEVVLAARHNPDLRERLRTLLAEWTVARDRTFAELVPLEDMQEQATFMQINLCVLRGLAVYDGLSEDKSLSRRVLGLWGEIAGDYVASRRRSGGRARSTLDRKRPTSNSAQ